MVLQAHQPKNIQKKLWKLSQSKTQHMHRKVAYKIYIVIILPYLQLSLNIFGIEQ